MTCDDFKHGLHLHFRGELPPGELPGLERHRDACPACAAIWAAADELSCRDFIEFLNDYIDGSLEEERRQVFDRHRAICSDCTNYLDSYRKTMQASVFALRAPVPPPPEELVRAILAARKRP